MAHCGSSISALSKFLLLSKKLSASFFSKQDREDGCSNGPETILERNIWTTSTAKLKQDLFVRLFLVQTRVELKLFFGSFEFINGTNWPVGTVCPVPQLASVTRLRPWDYDLIGFSRSRYLQQQYYLHITWQAPHPRQVS
jgi:hypothetical protein